MRFLNDYINEALIKKDVKINTHRNLGLDFNDFLNEIKEEYNLNDKIINKYRHALLLNYATKDIDKWFLIKISIEDELDSSSEQKILKDICKGLAIGGGNNWHNKNLLYGDDLKSIYEDDIDNIEFWKYTFSGTDDFFDIIIVVDKDVQTYEIYKIIKDEKHK